MKNINDEKLLVSVREQEAAKENAESNIIHTPIDCENTTDVAPAIDVKEQEQQRNYREMKQNAATNEFAKSRIASIDKVTHAAIMKAGNFSYAISNYEDIGKKTTTTHQLIDALSIISTQTNSPTVIIPLALYMEMRGLKDRKEARRQVVKDLELLKNTSVTGVEYGSNNYTQTYAFVNIADSGALKRNGDIVFSFGRTYYNALAKRSAMQYPTQLLKINSKRNPYSYNLLRKFSEHKHMNYGKPNEDVISVKTLLESLPDMPTYAEVMASDKHVYDRIISPFERDMDALAPTLSWHYCHQANTPLTDEELKEYSYKDFVKWLVKVDWVDYPDQTARIETKDRYIKKARSKKKREETMAKNKAAAEKKAE